MSLRVGPPIDIPLNQGVQFSGKVFFIRHLASPWRALRLGGCRLTALETRDVERFLPFTPPRNFAAADISGGCAPPPVARTTGEPQLLMLFESYFEPTPRYRGVRAAVVADGKATIGEANATNARSRADAVFRLLRTPAECYRSR